VCLEPISKCLGNQNLEVEKQARFDGKFAGFMRFPSWTPWFKNPRRIDTVGLNFSPYPHQL
jgi:hypothetical protein